MGKKIFISYKYSDTSVQHLDRNDPYETTKVRDYVDELQDKLSDTDHINKGEKDGEDLSQFKDETIASKLRDKIYDSSVTVVLISPNMKEYGTEEDQWIPWEISYSLKEATRADRTTRINAIIGVVLPDKSGSYNYAIQSINCGQCSCTTFNLQNMFSIIKNNTFNRKNAELSPCNQGKVVQKWPFSYIHIVKWEHFMSAIDSCLDEAIKIRDRANDFDLHKSIA